MIYPLDRTYPLFEQPGPGIDRNQWKFQKTCTKGATARPVPPLGQLIFFEGGVRRTKCHVVTQIQGYHLVCIWGSLVKFQGCGVVAKSMLFARVQIC